MIITIILGYGIYSEENTPYKNYLDITAGIIKGTRTDLIVTTGIASNKNFPSLTEAQSMKDYLADKVGGIPFFLEEKSLSTQQNISYSAELLNEKQKIPDKLVVICDSIRLPKTIFFTLHYSSVFNRLVFYGSLNFGRKEKCRKIKFSAQVALYSVSTFFLSIFLLRPKLRKSFVSDRRID